MKKIILFAFLLGNVALYGQSTVATINKGYKLNAGQYLDTRMGTILAGKSVPYSGVSAANAAIFPSFRCVGMTVLIDTLGTLKEYWYFGGTANGNLIEKGTVGTYTAAYGMLLSGTAFRVDSTVMTSQARLAAELTIKQDALISGTNIKTLGGNSLLGSGDFEVITPLQTVGGMATQLSINQATTGSDGYLSSTDWNTFNNKKNAADSTTASPANYVTQYQRKKTSDSLAALISAATGWGLTGNSGTTAGTNFIGTTDNQDLVFKRNSIESGRIGETNTSLGEGALAVNTGDDNVGIGAGALGENVGGYSNTAIGKNAAASIVGGASNTAIGEGAGFSNISGLSNVAIGSGGLYNATGNFNTALGASSLSQMAAGANNIGLGYSAGKYNSTLSNRLFINSLDRSNLAGDSTLSILYGFQAATIADQKLRVNGKFQIDDGTQGVGKVLVSDANGVGSWQTPSGGSGTEVYNEPSTGFTGTSMSTTNTPTTGTLRLFKNGIRLVLGYDYTITGSTVTLAVAAISSDYFIKDYKY